MANFSISCHYNTSKNLDVIRVTQDAKRALKESGFKEGLVNVFLPVSCACILLIEDQPDVIEGVKTLLSDLIPESDDPRPNRRSGTGQVAAHLKATLLGNTLVIPAKDSKLQIGSWQEIMLFDFDDKQGRREVIYSVQGEGGASDE